MYHSQWSHLACIKGGVNKGMEWNDAILSKRRADSFTMNDPQVPVNAVQEAHAVLQNPAPDEAHAPAQAGEVSLEVL